VERRRQKISRLREREEKETESMLTREVWSFERWREYIVGRKRITKGTELWKPAGKVSYIEVEIGQQKERQRLVTKRDERVRQFA